jgi:hypothetical protein
MADSIMCPVAECSWGIGTPIKIPLSSLSLMFASARRIKIRRNHIGGVS